MQSIMLQEREILTKKAFAPPDGIALLYQSVKICI